MKRFACLVLAVVLLGSPALAADLPAAISPSAPPRAIDPVTNESVAIDPAPGPMHVVFLATWCRPCLTEMPKLFDLEDRWKADGYRLVLVAVSTRQSVERLREFRAQNQLPGRLLFDDGGSVATAFGAATIPAHVLIDRSGRIVARAGALDAPFTQAIERLVRQEGRVKP